MRVLALAFGLFALGCQAPDATAPPRSLVQSQVVRGPLANHVRILGDAPISYDVYCAKKHTLADAQAVGLSEGCTSAGPPDSPLAIVTLPSTVPYPGDEAEGYLCSNCASIEAAIAAAAAADMTPAQVVKDPGVLVGAPVDVGGTPVVGVQVIGGNLWGNDSDGQAWELVGGILVKQASLPAEWPVN